MKRCCLLILAWFCLLGARAQDSSMQEGATAVVDSVAMAKLSPDKLTLLVYYDPDCQDCRQELFALKHASIVESKISEGLLQVLAIYQGDDATLWQEHRQSLPATWQVVMLPPPASHPLSISLLDADRKVMLSQVSSRQIILFLSELWE